MVVILKFWSKFVSIAEIPAVGSYLQTIGRFLDPFLTEFIGKSCSYAAK
jgi:hypothetical protein